MTRENPATGADELLVFDVLPEPGFTAIVPGGGIEEGESVEETAVREVLEETGASVKALRVLGAVEQGGGYVSHFVQAVPTERLPDTWEHEVTGTECETGVAACRWVPVSADTEVWGLRGAFIHALVRERVVAYVTREGPMGLELLTIEQGDIDAGVQVPAGRLDPGESPEQGLAREVEEETGITGVSVVRRLADPDEFERLYGPGAHRSHAFHAEVAVEGTDEWEHRVGGTGADAGFVYRCRWVRLDECPPLWGDADPLVEKLRRSITES
ncbi:MAG: NUDIX domain-containing protein [Actinobacteria bacterium]|nr:NUDIX domain-containing protein [Actinomycetota bacterium]